MLQDAKLNTAGMQYSHDAGPSSRAGSSANFVQLNFSG